MSQLSGRSRLPLLAPDVLDEVQARLYRTIVEGPRGPGGEGNGGLADHDGSLRGPFNAFLHAPHVGDPLQQLGAALRYRSLLSDPAREIAILLTAAHHRSTFEWSVHAGIARAAGVDEATMEAIRRDAPLALSDPVERAVARAVQGLLSDGDLDDAAFMDLVALLGHAVLVEVTALVGYYSTLALQLRVFRVDPPMTELFPPSPRS